MLIRWDQPLEDLSIQFNPILLRRLMVQDLFEPGA